MPTRSDPTRTTLLQRRFEAEIRKRLNALKGATRHLLVTLDAFGLAKPSNSFFFNVERKQFAFQTNEQKLASFRTWLQGQLDEGILEIAGDGQPWNAKFIDAAYRKGTVRAFVDVRRLKLDVPAGFIEGTQAEFLRSTFAQPERLSKVRFLATRAFEELRGVSNAVAQQLNRALAQGIATGQSPRAIARQISSSITSISRKRAQVIARTEIVAAHAEGQLDAFQDLGIEEVGVQAEWQTAGDDRVCPDCAANEGQLFTIDQARGLIPLHPNCRCAWIPAESVDTRNRRRRSLQRRRRARRQAP